MFAREFNDIAYEKGYDSIKYFWYCFLFGIVGYLPVFALPDTEADTKTYTQNKCNYSLSDLAGERENNELKMKDTWICKNCNTKNDKKSLFCNNCGTYR